MNTDETRTLKDALAGGPGLNGYAYNADVYCVECGQDVARKLWTQRKGVAWTDLEFCDSQCVPQPIFFGESEDCAMYCSDCGEYLYGGP